jgi:hypothetical protein
MTNEEQQLRDIYCRRPTNDAERRYYWALGKALVALDAEREKVAKLEAALTRIDDFKPSINDENPYLEIAVFSKKTARAALVPKEPHHV